MGTTNFDAVTVTGALTGASVTADTVSEKTAGAGVTIDGALLKDGELTVSGTGKRNVKVRALAIVGGAGSSGVFASWQNPESNSILVIETKLLIATGSTGASTLDIGYTATNATTSSDNLIDGLSGATGGVFSNLNATERGTNGKSGQMVLAGKWINVAEASGDVNGLMATLYIHYILV